MYRTHLNSWNNSPFSISRHVKKAIHQKEVLEELGKLEPVWKEEIEQECMKNFNTFENKSTEAS